MYSPQFPQMDRANSSHQVRRHLPEKQRYTLELLDPLAGEGGGGQRMDVRHVNFVLAHLPAGTRCARARTFRIPLRCSLVSP